MAELTSREIAFLLGGTTVGATGAGFAGYFFAKRKYLALMESELAVESEYFKRKLEEMTEAPVKAPPEEKPSLEKVVEDLGYKKVSTGPPAQMVADAVNHNVFEDAEPTTEWNYDREISQRDETKPYVIHKDEFMEGMEEHEQSTFTYFSGDDVLCDERDTPIDNRDMMIGEENLEKFGHGSEDANVVYIRNEPLGMDFEIVKSDGHFVQEVHGLDPSESTLEHSAMRRRHPRGLYDE